MPYELKLSPEVQVSIRAYVNESVEYEYRLEVIGGIMRGLDSLAANPLQGLNHHSPGPPLFRFQVFAGDEVRRYLQVTFRFTEDENGIWISSFGRVPF
jgi:hypothetical protein